MLHRCFANGLIRRYIFVLNFKIINIFIEIFFLSLLFIFRVIVLFSFWNSFNGLVLNLLVIHISIYITLSIRITFFDIRSPFGWISFIYYLIWAECVIFGDRWQFIFIIIIIEKIIIIISIYFLFLWYFFLTFGFVNILEIEVIIPIRRTHYLL